MNRLSQLLLCVIALACIGCVERTISITSQPEGALVHLNDVEVGRTPLEVPFTHYGEYDVRLHKDGYQPLWTTAVAKTPWWDMPGPDLVAETTDAQSHIDWHFELQPAPEGEQYLVSHAKQMRAKLNSLDGAQAAE